MNEYPPEFEASPSMEVGRAVKRWRDDILSPTLDELFTNLRHLEELEEVKLDTVLDVEEAMGPQLPYIKSSLAASFIRNLPIASNLKKLTLDLCSGLDYDESEGAHLCDELSPLLHRIEVVRLRLRMICPSLFKLPANIDAKDIKLESFVLKMHQPQFEFSPRRTPASCFSMTSSHAPSQGMFRHWWVESWLIKTSSVQDHDPHSEAVSGRHHIRASSKGCASRRNLVW